ncbi:Dps family protein [Nocardia sp. NPDC049526]|uniref:Dps family protein n=1 Tax=Nocardia sp. NPDC049526 TaxID=3364316 RepID=UPI0037AAE804
MSTTSIFHDSAVDASGFRASPRMRANLQQILTDLIALQLLGKQAHWNVVGTNFRDLHLQLDEIVDIARAGSDTIAERMRALDAVPDGRPETVAATTMLTAFPGGEQNTAAVVELICDRLRTTAGTMRAVHDAVDVEDPSTADLLHPLIDDIEKQRWMLSAENRTAQSTR